MAEAIRAHRDLGVDDSQPIDPFLALQRSGVLVMRQSLDRLAGVYLPADISTGRPPGVLINVAHPPSKQRYTAAHELWHHRRDRDLVLDADTEWLARGDVDKPERERLAEVFASWFLMPKRLVVATMEMLGLTVGTLDGRSIYAMSLELGTSYASTVRQLHGLKLISTHVRDSLLKVTPQSIKKALGNMDLAADPWRDVRVVSPRIRGRDIDAVEGDVIVLELPEIPSTGYVWQTAAIPETVSLERSEYHSPSADELGGQGSHHFVFSVTGTGRQVVRLELSRPWQPNDIVDVKELALSSEPIPKPGVIDPLVLVGAVA